MPIFGMGSRLKSGREMPNAIYFDLATWHTINLAYTRQRAADLGALSPEIVDVMRHTRLLRLIERRDGHRLAIDVEAAKVALSANESHVLSLQRIEPALTHEITRASFNDATRSLVDRVGAKVDEVLAQAGVASQKVDSVYLTGGGSAVPALRARIARALPCARLIEGDLFGSIGAGLAVVAARRYGMVAR